MTSAQSLIGLVSQLQTMESSFTSILMEAALKLASLTDASIFMLVETPEGRRYAGRHHLCSAYQRGQLLPLANDKEMEADANTIGLKEKQGHATSNLYSEQFSEPIFCAGANMGGGGGRKRSRGSGNNEQSVSPAKHSKLNKARTAGADIMPSVPVKEEFDDYEVVHEGDDPGNSREGDESDIEEVYANDTHDFHDGSFNGSFNMINQSTNLSSALVPSSQQLDQLDHTEIEQALAEWIELEFRRKNQKVVVLEQVTDPSIFENKSNVEWKIMSSTCYDYAKMYAHKFSALSRKVAFDHFWSIFVNLHPHENHSCYYKKRNYPLKALFRQFFTSNVSSWKSKDPVKFGSL